MGVSVGGRCFDQFMTTTGLDPLEQLDSAAQVLEFVREEQAAEDRAARNVLLAAIAWAEQHPPESITDAATWKVPGFGGPKDTELTLAGPGAPTVAEFAIAEGEAFAPGDQVKVSIFSEKDFVDVTGVSKGKGFQGVMKRHGFRGGRSSHGSMFHRAPGSIGGSSNPSRVFPGTRMAGQTGSQRVTVRNLEIVQVDADDNLLVVKGAVPGPNGSYVLVRRSRSRT